ncbi:hypothetical protein M3Y94_00042300 [Aphelenchoides besseyi]|nr:hypothetical protein M3Y94_00042300 [Aphelenchoides besseyi]
MVVQFVKTQSVDFNDLPEFTAEQVRDAGQSRCVVILYGLVYDLTDFLDLHPGGAEIIYEMLVTQLLSKQTTTEEGGQQLFLLSKMFTTSFVYMILILFVSVWNGCNQLLRRCWSWKDRPYSNVEIRDRSIRRNQQTDSRAFGSSH